jgi:hypothetical protein
MSSGRSRKGGTASLEHGEAVEQVLAEAAVLHLRAQVAVGGGDEAHVDVAHLIAADRADLAELHRAQQRRLQIERQFADFVEEQCAAVGGFEQAGALLVGAGERALGVAEQLALDELARHRAAVHDDERLPVRAEPACRRRATSSLPVPLSPAMSTLWLAFAMRAICWSSAARRSCGW